MEDHVFKQSVPATISNYLLKTSGAESLANFSLVAGLQWTGQGGGGEQEGTERMVHRLLLQRVDMPKMSSCFQEVDMVMFPDEDDQTLTNLTKLLYHGRYTVI